MLSRINDLSQRYFALWVLIAGLIGWFFPRVFLAPAELAPSIKLYVTVLLGILMFGMGMTLEAKDFARIAKRPVPVGIGIAAQFGLMPLLGWLIAQLLGLPPELAAGVILVGCCPGGTASNVICYLAKADVALSVLMTSASTLLAPILTPLLFQLYAGSIIDVSALAMMKSIMIVVIVPLTLGVAAHHLARRAVERSTVYLPLISVVAVILIVGLVMGLSKGKIQAGGIAMVFLAVVIHNGLGLGFAWGGGKLLKLEIPQRRTLAIEVGMQNSGLANQLAIAHLSGPAAIPAAIFSVWHNITGPALATLWNRRN